MTSFGIVKKAENGYATVKIKRNSMCSDDCGSCNLCGKRNIEIKAKNGIGARDGDKVEIKMPDQSGFLASLLAYGIPVLILLVAIIIGAVAGKVELAGAVALGVIVVWYVVLMLFEKNNKYSEKLTPVIIKIQEENNG